MADVADIFKQLLGWRRGHACAGIVSAPHLHWSCRVRLLAIETATEACSVALLHGQQVVQRFEIAPRRHAELVLPWADAVLAEAGLARTALDGIAVSTGPGAFTGVRLGLSLAQGMALALDRPLIGISTLAVLAAGLPADDGTQILAAIDARMGEVYVQPFVIRDGSPQPLADAQVLPPGDVVLGDGQWCGIGTGFAAADGLLAQRFADQLSQVDASALPHAADLVRLAASAYDRGEAKLPEQVEPVYLRNNVAMTIAERQAAGMAK